jgi:predicted transcriptional regulator
MIDQLFGSKTRVKLLHLFYNNPGRPYFVREITRTIDEQINSVRRELSNLLNVGIISSENSDNKLYYQLNEKYQHAKALGSIFTSAKSEVTEEMNTQQQRYRNLGDVKLLYLMGFFVREKTAPVDLFVVGDVTDAKLKKLVAELEKEKGDELNYSVLSHDEYQYRRDLNDRFIITVEDAKKSVVVDELSRDNK